MERQSARSGRALAISCASETLFMELSGTLNSPLQNKQTLVTGTVPSHFDHSKMTFRHIRPAWYTHPMSNSAGVRKFLRLRPSLLSSYMATVGIAAALFYLLLRAELRRLTK
jgi:hypothetical protein